MVTGEDHCFFGHRRAIEAFAGFFVQVQKAPQHLEPGIRLHQALPQVAGGVLAVVRRLRVARAAFRTAEVEWQEEGVFTRQLGGHRHLVLAHSKVHQRAALEGQQRLGFTGQRVFYRAVVTVLALGVFYRLLKLAFQFQRRRGEAVDEQHQIQPWVVALPAAASLTRMGRVGHFRHHAQAVALVTFEGVRVHAVVGLEAAQLDLYRWQLKAVAQHIQGAALLQLAHQLLHQHAIRIIGVGLGELVPTLWPGVLEVTQHIFGIQRRAAVVAAGGADQPA
ncbi:hypothetical protein D3C77_440700 [compost metagenome]